MGGSSDGPTEFAFGAHGPCEDGKPVFRINSGGEWFRAT
jgi:hypothetical protein